jgi:hypothetical protein
MSIVRELDLDKRVRMWTVYDRFYDEVVKIIMEEGELQFYAPVDDWPGPQKEFIHETEDTKANKKTKEKKK